MLNTGTLRGVLLIDDKSETAFTVITVTVDGCMEERRDVLSAPSRLARSRARANAADEMLSTDDSNKLPDTINCRLLCFDFNNKQPILRYIIAQYYPVCTEPVYS